jgi:hypothetical protein
MTEKMHAHHLERKAVLFVRQSSPYQVVHNAESPRLQYAMRERLRPLGWHQIAVIDDDLGRSASGTVRRSGFEDVSQVLMCYSPQESLQPTTLNVIEWPHDAPGLALSSLSRDRHCTPWSEPARHATVPVSSTPLCGAHVPAGVQ